MTRIRRALAVAGTLPVLLAAMLVVPAWGADPEASSGSFSAAGALPEERNGATAILLSDGRVLVVGGSVGADLPPASAFVWEPVARAFAPAGSLSEPRHDPTSTLLSDGRVLVVGGLTGFEDGQSDVAPAEIWDPATGAFSSAASLADGRFAHTSTLLPDGRVLVVGGISLSGDGRPVTYASAELWEPATGAFSPAGSLLEGRYGHTSTLLPDGRVLILGGVAFDAGSLDFRASAEMWEPDSESFGSVASLPRTLIGHTATLLPDGRVLVVGGVTDGGAALNDAAFLWEPKTEDFSPGGSLAVGRQTHTATLLPDGRVLVVGGDDGSGSLDGAELWDPDTGSFHAAGSLAVGRSGHAATLLPDGQVLVVAGYADGAFLASAESWAPFPMEVSEER
jgi:WD40 repeat protein